MICTLRVIEGPSKGETRQLSLNQKLSVGRIESDLCVANDPHLSRHHLIIEGVDTAFRVRDVGSSNGTFLNESRIAIAQLCTGDRIQAGSSVFEIQFETRGTLDEFRPTDGSSAIPAEPNENADSATQLPQAQRAWVPKRPLSVNDSIGATMSSPDSSGDFNAEETALYNMHSRPKVRGLDPESLQVPKEFLAEFEMKPRDLWVQRFDKKPSELVRVIDKLTDAAWPARFQLIINRAQLQPEDHAKLEFAYNAGECRAITETLFMLSNAKHQLVLEFYKRCLGQDCAICIASSGPVRSTWIEESVGLFSYPSMLSGSFANSSSNAPKLDDGVSLIMFEPSRNSELNLLCRNHH